MKTLEEILAGKNQFSTKAYMETMKLPSAFSAKKVYDVVEALKKAGYKVFDVLVGGRMVHMARQNEVEIYFDNNQAVYTTTDYGHTDAKTYSLALEGACITGMVPQALWINV